MQMETMYESLGVRPDVLAFGEEVLEGLRERLGGLLGMPVHMGESPEDDVAAGAGAIAADERLAADLRRSGCLIEL